MPVKRDINTYVKIFEELEKEGWDIASQLKWSFFFLDNNKAKLNLVFTELVNSDYKLKELKKVNGVWRLHVMKFERLTPEKLFKRNLAFDVVADFFDIQCYDGWEVSRN